MALLTDLETTNIGVPLKGTYARILTVLGDKNSFMITVAHYLDASTRAADAQPVLERAFAASVSQLLPASDPLAMAYAWLKTQPEYADSVDC